MYIYSLYITYIFIIHIAVQSYSLGPHGLQHARLPCPSPSPWACLNSCPLSRWCHPTILSSVIPFCCLQSFPASGSFLMSDRRIRWPKYWSFSFSISPSNENSGLISFRIDCFDLLAVQGTLNNLFPIPQFKSINSLVLSLPNYWKTHSFDYTDICWQSNVSAF